VLNEDGLRVRRGVGRFFLYKYSYGGRSSRRAAGQFS